jgi:hypothetical protein
VAERGTLAQLREFAIHRSAYQLKEADPHTWAIPRSGSPCAPSGWTSATAPTWTCCPAPPSPRSNLVSFFGLHRRWRGALVGHLAVFEMTSVEPMGRYSLAMRRLGFGPVARHFYEVHVVADAHHEQVTARQLAAGLAAQDPRMAADILLGARAIMAVEGRFSANLMAAWSAGRTALLRPGRPGPPGRPARGGRPCPAAELLRPPALACPP